MKLNVSQWGSFFLSELFNIQGTKTTSLLDLEDYGSGKFPYITTQSENNGVAGFFDYWTEKGNVLTVDSAVTGFCSYHSENFSASDHVEKLVPLFNMTKNIGLFFVTIINMQQYKFSYGRKASQKKLKSEKIKLPITKDGKPDFNFMEQYIKSLHHKAITTKITTTPSKPDTRNWKNFRIGNLFRLEIGKAHNGMLSDGTDCFYLGAKKNDNGLMRTCAYDADLVQNGNCIVFICNGQGSVGYTNYMDKPFIATTDLVMGYNEHLNQYVGLFLVTVLDLERPRYSFGRKWKTHLADTEIKLPATSDGNPDWNFMESYIKSFPYSDRI